MHKYRRMILGITYTLMIGLMPPFAWSCSRILAADDSQAIMVGRNMDWFEDMHSNL